MNLLYSRAPNDSEGLREMSFENLCPRVEHPQPSTTWRVHGYYYARETPVQMRAQVLGSELPIENT